MYLGRTSQWWKLVTRRFFNLWQVESRERQEGPRDKIPPRIYPQ
jgi:hypothetical protein